MTGTEYNRISSRRNRDEIPVRQRARQTVPIAMMREVLSMAHQRRRPTPGLLHHSDHGSQYASEDYRKLLYRYGMEVSMNRKGDCLDNVVVESFFVALKTELVHHRKYRTPGEAKRDTFEYTEVFYNRQRLHSSLGYLSLA